MSSSRVLGFKQRRPGGIRHPEPAFLLTIPLVRPVLRDLKQREKDEAEFRVPDTAGAALFDIENA